MRIWTDAWMILTSNPDSVWESLSLVEQMPATPIGNVLFFPRRMLRSLEYDRKRLICWKDCYIKPKDVAHFVLNLQSCFEALTLWAYAWPPSLKGRQTHFGSQFQTVQSMSYQLWGRNSLAQEGSCSLCGSLDTDGEGRGWEQTYTLSAYIPPSYLFWPRSSA